MNLGLQPTRALLCAERNLAANQQSLAWAQTEVTIAELPSIGEWLFGRDGYLTARDAQQKWITGCSIPRRAAEQILRSLHISGPVACFLAPGHAARIRVALDRLAPEQAIIAVVPDARELPFILSCDDFSREIRGHRLWFVVGEAWEARLAALLESRPGLNVPAQFIRMPNLPVESMIAPAQKIFSQITSDRAVQIASLRTVKPLQTRGICVVAPSTFRLWNDVSMVAEVLDELATERVDISSPASASPMAIASAAAKCSAIVTIDTARADSPGLISEQRQWLTWITSPRIPAPAASAPSDQLLVIDPILRERAITAGWPANRVHIAGLPCAPDPGSRAPRAIAIIENTAPVDAPVDLNDLSSHRVLWDSIARQLLENPFALDDDAVQLISNHAVALDVAVQTLDLVAVRSRAGLAAYAQGVARALVDAKLPVKLFGRGWDRIPRFASHASGAIDTREELAVVLAQPIALAHVWPWLGAHTIDATRKPILRRRDASLQTLLRDAQQLLRDPRAFMPAPINPPLSADLIRRVLHSRFGRPMSDNRA